MAFIEKGPRGVALVRRMWARRRWAYGAYIAVAVLRIPARVGFRLVPPPCDTRVTLVNARLSMTKLPHIVLFAVFFLLTALQFERLDQRALRRSFLATIVLGVLVELEEGASRTGNCRLTDVLPDVAGALIASSALVAALIARHRLRRESAPGD